jgi:hypothetical protein
MILNPFRKPSPLALATQELEDAQREHLVASSAAEYAEAMCIYHQQRIERLRATIADLTAPPEPFPIGAGSDRFADE